VTDYTFLRMPLSFHAVSFGNDSYTGKLRRMVQIAQEVEKGAPRNSLTNSIPSSFTEALDSVNVVCFQPPEIDTYFFRFA
jgi:hypothetical protein